MTEHPCPRGDGCALNMGARHCFHCRRNWPPDATWEGVNPRYVAYAAAHDLDPDTMLAADAVFWPGGKMTGFMVWIGERWREWRERNGKGAHEVLWSDDHADFDRFIGAAT